MLYLANLFIFHKVYDEFVCLSAIVGVSVSCSLHALIPINYTAAD